MHLLWGMRDEEELYFEDRLAAVARPRLQVTLCLSRPSPEWGGARGHINGHLLTALPKLEKPVFYLVGNGAMVRELKDGLIAAGVDRKRHIRTEIFYPEARSAS